MDKGSNVSDLIFEGLTTSPLNGYEAATNESGKYVFYTGYDCNTEFSGTTFGADTTLYVKFVPKTYSITLDTLATASTGINDGKVTHGTDAKFTVTNTDGDIISKVTYKIGSKTVTIKPDATGSYTIPGAKILGDVTVDVVTLAEEVFGSTTTNKISALFIKRDAAQGEDVEGSGAYMAKVVQNSDMKILALVSEAFKATDYAGTNKFFQLANGTQLYWSPRYQAYVCWVSKDMKAADLDGFVKFDGSKTATAIVNGGDINFDNAVDSADAGIVNDALHGTRQVPTSALQLFEMDVANTSETSYVDGATIDADDVTWILKNTVTPNSVAKTFNPLLGAQPQ